MAAGNKEYGKSNDKHDTADFRATYEGRMKAKSLL